MAWMAGLHHVESPNYGYPRGKHFQLGQNIVTYGGAGETWHSMVGSLNGAKARFLNPDEGASAHFLFPKVGIPTQMVDSADAAWHAGGEIHDDPIIGSGPDIGSILNLHAHGFEFEGGPQGNLSEPLTENQISWGIAVTKWLRLAHGVRLIYVLRETLWQHNWVYATACPSNRIPWSTIIPALKEDNVTQDEFNAMANQWILSQTGLTIAQLKTIMVDSDADNAEALDAHENTFYHGATAHSHAVTGVAG